MTFRGNISSGIVAAFTEPVPGNGIADIFDINAPRNAPAKNPAANLGLVQWHVDFFQYELAFPIQTVPVDHPALAGAEKYWGPSNQYWMGDPTYTSAISYRVPGQTGAASRVLFNHGLGYVPLAFIALDGRMLMPGVAAQIESNGKNRFVSPFVTSQAVGLREVINSYFEPTPAVSRTYQVLVFRVPLVEAQRALFGKEGSKVVIGRGKIDTSRRYLKRGVPPQSSPFAIDRGPTVDISFGRSRIVTGGQVSTEGGYLGNFAGPAFVSVGV